MSLAAAAAAAAVAKDAKHIGPLHGKALLTACTSHHSKEGVRANGPNGMLGENAQGGLTWLWLDAPYVITARKLFNMALEANNNGDVFPVSPYFHINVLTLYTHRRHPSRAKLDAPHHAYCRPHLLLKSPLYILQIHGTCLGFQLLHILASNVSRNDLLIETNSTSHASTLKLMDAAADSIMFGSLNVSAGARRRRTCMPAVAQRIHMQPYACENYPGTIAVRSLMRHELSILAG
eukprot:357001-Chlamydomonas_euryale.AAC.17